MGLLAAMALGGVTYAWVNRPARAPGDDGDAQFTRMLNVTNEAHSFGGNVGGHDDVEEH